MTSQKRRELMAEILDEWKLVNKKFEGADKAACKGMTDMFFPEKGDAEGSVNKAKAVCATCSVKDDCLEFALDNSFIYGVWGGMSARQRKTYKAQLRRAKP